MPGSPTRTLAALLALGSPLRAATAQRPPPPPPRIEVGALVGRASADGPDFSGTNAGWAYRGSVRVRLAGQVSIGVGLHSSDHTLKSLPEHLRIRGVYVEPRIAAQALDPRLRLFLGARGGWVTEHISIVDWTARGWIAGAVLGGNWRIARLVSLEVLASETAVHLGNRHLADGTTVIGSTANGSSLGLDVGLLLTF